MLDIIAIILACSILVWLLFEFWRAPHFQKGVDGYWKQIKPTKKLRDLFKFKK